MPSLAVEFEMPQEIFQGLLSGEYKRFGGVIRNDSGEIVKHLIETGEILSSNDVSVMKQMQALGLGNQLSLSTNLLTLGIMTVGFIVLNNKLIKIENRLSDIAGRLKEMDRKIDFIQDKIDVQIMARLRAAVNMGDNALFSKDRKEQQFLKAQEKFIEAKYSFQGLLEKIEENYGIVNMYETYAHYGACYLTSAMGEAHCSLYLGDYEVALNSIKQSAQFIGIMNENYQASFNPRRVAVQKISHKEIPQIKMYQSEFDEMRKRVDSALEQVNLMLRNNLSYYDMDRLCQGNSNVPIAYLTETI